MAITSINRNVVTQSLTASGNVQLESDQVQCDCTGGAITATLYTAPGDGAYHRVVVEKTDATASTVTVTDSTFSFILNSQYDSVICELTQAGAWIGTASFDALGAGNVVGPASATDGAPALFDGATGKIIKNSVPTGSGVPVLATSPTLVTPTLGVASATSLTIANTGKLRITPKTNDTFAATMTIDVTIAAHVIAVANGTSATCTMTPSAAGNAGDFLYIEQVADASGTVTTTYASTFHSSGTQATTLSRFSTILFYSDGTRWVEVCRTTALA